jgi:WD40 repeat protein
MPAIFISHSNLDRDASDKIKGLLEGFGYERIFLDFDKTTGIGAGENWERKLYDEINRCHAVILVLTSNWLNSKWCFVEFAQARALGKMILPVACGPMEKNSVISEIQVVDAVNLDAHGLERLEKKLSSISDELARGFSLEPGRAPYPGIHSFEAEDAAIFFGRDEETRGVIERLEARRNQGGARLIVIIGASGSGKSSVLKAGVLPQLARRRGQWAVLPAIRPEKRPLEALAKSISHYLKTPEKWREWHDVLKDSESALSHIQELLKDMRIGEARSTTVLLPIDQFEEVFTIAEPEERDRIIRFLTAALNPERQLPLMVVATGRSDVLQGLLESGDLGQLCETVPLVQMPLDRVSRLVDGPAAIAGLNVETGLTELIVRDLESSEALPLLAYTLYLLHQRSVDKRKLTISEYRLLGDYELKLNPIQNSVRLVADQAIATLTPSQDELDALRDAFIPYLVRVRLDDGRRVRQQARMNDLPESSRRLVQALVNARLLSVRVQSDDGPHRAIVRIVEVAHEALFKAWPTLDAWLTAEQDFLNDVERLKATLEIWKQAADTSKGEALLQGLMLTRARDWLNRYPQRFLGRDMASLQSFISLSAQADDAKKAQEASQQERSRRTRRLLFRGAIVAALIFAAIAFVAGVEYLQANKALKSAETERNVALTNQSLFLTDFARQQYANGDFGTAMALSLEALPDDQAKDNRPYLADAESMLYQSMTALSELHILQGHAAQLSTAVFSPDGRLIVTAAWDKSARIWDANTGKMLAELKGHGDRLDSAAFSSDGARVATASWDKTARIWDTTSGKQLVVLRGHKDEVYSAAFSPHGRRVVTASKDGTARVWDAETGIQRVVLNHHGEVYTAVFSPDGKTILTASADQTAIIWDSVSGAQIQVLRGHDDAVFAAAFSGDGKRVVTASWDKTARIWTAATGTELATLRGHDDVVLSAAFSPDGQTVITASADKTARIWNANNGTPVSVLRGHSKQVVAAVFSPDGRRVATASGDGTARIWSASDGVPLTILRGHDGWVFSTAWSPDSRRIVTASADATARIWAASGDAEVVTLRGHEDRISAIAFSPDGRWTATASDDHTARVWDAKTGAQVALLQGHTDRVSAIAFSPDGNKVVTASWDSTARIWDAASGSQLLVLHGHQNRINSIAFSPNGTRLVTTSWDNSARIWDAATGNQTALLSGHTNLIQSAVFSPNNKWVATASNDDTARIWDATTGAQIAVVTGHTNWVHSVEFSPDSQRIVTASQDSTAGIWETSSGKQLALLQGHSSQVQSAKFSPDARYVVTASWDNTARIWDSRSGVQIRSLEGHQDRLETALFLPDGARVVTASWDKTARIWDVSTGAEVAILRGHEDQIHAVALSSDGRRLATASDDKTARLWPIFATTQELVQHAKAIMPRELGPDQRQRFFLAAH